MRKAINRALASVMAMAMCLSVASPVLTAYAEDATAPTADSYVDAGDTADVSPFDSIATPDTSDTEAADTEAADTEPADAETTDTEAADTETADTETADTEPADAEPSEPEPEAQPAEPATPETAAEPLAVLDPESTVITANVGDSVTLGANLNREDVEVTYQWQVMRQPAAAEIEPVYQYAEDAPTWYNYPLEDKPEADLLAENPAATWQGMETYLAIVDALDEIGEGSTAVSLAWRTENYALEGYAISAANVDGQVQIYADKGDTRYTATLNSDNKWEFDATEGAATYSWQDIEGATDSHYSFEVTNADYYSSYRCAVTVTDADYLAQCARQLADNGTELTDEQRAADQVLYSLVMTVESPEATTPETAAVEDIALYAATGSSTTPHLSADAQWIEGLNNNFEYITKDTYDRISQWLAEGKIDDDQAKRYWTRIFENQNNMYAYANVLDANGFPTGETRRYAGFTLTNGALEVNSEWYGKTVYFRVHGSTGTGTAVKIPAYTDLTVDSDGNYIESSAGSRYKKAVTFLNPFVSDTGSMYSNFLSTVSTDGWLLNMDGSGNFTTPSDIHIRVYTVNCESFNATPVAWCPGELQDSQHGHYDLDCTIYMVGCDSYTEPETTEPDGDAGGSGNLQALAAASNGGSLTRTVRKLSQDGASYTTSTTQRYTKTVTLPQSDSGFTGWDTDAIEWAELLYKMDWEDLYNVTDGIKCRTVGTRLTDEELAAILQALGLMDGDPRAQVVGFALACQGRFSYGQPTSLRGSAGAAIVGSNLDCSSFIQYCYWSLGLPFSAKTTASYAGAGDLVEISPSQIQPGDLRVVYASGGTQGHVQMYVGGNAWIECAAGYGVGLNLSNGFMTSRPCHYFSYVGF